jgi:TolB-like protein/Tfp pilus assembly protein PilF
MTDDDARFLEIAGLILDGQPVAWDTVPDVGPPDDAADALRLIAEVAALHRAPTGEPGRRWGTLAIQEQIGHGTFGDVYRARDAALDRDVALKLVDHAPSATAPEEGRLLARVRHSNVVTVYGAALHDGRYGIWMEFIRGRTLAAVVREHGPLAPEDVTAIGIDVCRALTAVHASGLLHGDIKPQNVMREEGGRIVVMDFGTGRLATGEGQRDRLAGTPLYLAPEVLRGAAPDVRADVYSAGVLLYYLLTGAHPVEGSTLNEVRAAHAAGARTPVRSRRTEMPRPVAAIIERAIAVEPSDRFESAADFERALRDLLAKRSRAVSKRFVVLIGVSVVIAVLAGRRELLSPRASRAQPAVGSLTRAVQSIAVLPLVNLSGDPAQEYFADGMTEALITDLGKIRQLRVISRTSVMQYKATKKSLPEVARELRVDAFVEGAVARAGDHVRITAKLVQASPEKQLWADSFERDLRDVLALQDDVALAIANRIRVTVTPQEQARLASAHPVNPEALEAYLEGRYFVEKFWPQAAPKAIPYFEVAVKKDPGWALPYSGLANAYQMQGSDMPMPNDICRQAKAMALEAVKRDAEAAEAHASLAGVEFWCEWDWSDFVSEIRQAIELNPNFGRAHGAYGFYLLLTGQTNEGLAETQRATELDPVWYGTRGNRMLSLYLAGHYDGAAEQCRKMQELNPDIDLGRLYCGVVDVENGKLAEGVRELQEAVTLSEGRERQVLADPAYANRKAVEDLLKANPQVADLAYSNRRAVAYLAYAYARAGRGNDAQNLLTALLEISKHTNVHPALIARVYAGLGQKEDAFEWLEKAYRVRGRDLLLLQHDPCFASLRSDPRFLDLVRRIGLRR